MATKTWAKSGGDFLTTSMGSFSAGGSNASASPAWDAACAAWVGTNNENGDTGTVSMAGDGGSTPFANMQVGVLLENDSSINPADACNTIRIVFDWDITNGPMGTATADSAFNSTVDGSDDPHGAGTSSGTYDRSIDGTSFGTPTMGDLFSLFGDPGGFLGIGFNYVVSYSAGTFSVHNRRLAVSNFQVIVNYGAAGPTLDSLTPDHGDKAGSMLVTLSGSGLTGATSVTFGGSEASQVTVVNDTTVTCLTPAHAVGLVDVTVTVP
jgi:hypothetical protein